MADGENSDTIAEDKTRRRTMIGLSPCLVRCPDCLNDLPDCLLAEILCRLSTFKLAIHCKFVCKRWYSLISSPLFIPRFLSFRRTCNSGCAFSSAVCFNYYTMNGRYRFHIPHSDSPYNPRSGLSLSYLPEERWGTTIVASCNDLLLCWTQKEDCNAYYLCNPLTMQWFAIYSPLTMRRSLRDSLSLIRFGLICEPYYYYRGDGECTINAGYRFAIVRMDKINTDCIMVETYSSDTGNWGTSYLVGAEYRFPGGKLVPYNGKLHWYNGVDVVAYDPLDGSETRFIDGSEFGFIRDEFTPYMCTQLVLDVSQDWLQCIRLARDTRNGDTTVSIWELKDYKMGKWSLERMLCIKKMVTNDPWVGGFLQGTMSAPTVMLALHPNNKNILYLELGNRVVSCNLEREELELVAEIPDLYPGLYKHFHAYSLVLPWWPTPLPPARQIVLF